MKLTRTDLYSLEDYARVRSDFRAETMRHKLARKAPLGEHATLHFEDRRTIQYQIQEMLRAERIFEADDIQSELDAYNPLIPDGSNWKATLMIEYPSPEERHRALTKLRGIEKAVWVQVEGCEPVYAIADEDLERENEHKTSAVHFLRFELPRPDVDTLKNGASLSIGCSHPDYACSHVSSPELRASLLADLHLTR